MDTNKNIEYIPFLYLKLFIYESEKQLVLKRLSAKPNNTRDPCYFLIDIFSLSNKKIVSTPSKGKLVIKHNDTIRTIEINEYSTFNWINSKITLSTYCLDNIVLPLYVKVTAEGAGTRDAVIDYNPVLDGIPQRCQIDADTEIALTVKLVNNIQLFKNSIALNQILYKTLEGSYDEFLNNKAPIIPAKPDVSSYKIIMNVWKLENFSSEINRLKIKNPCLSVMVWPFLMRNQTINNPPPNKLTHKYLFPRDPSVQYNLLNSSDMPIGGQIEMEHKLPTDYRLLPKFDMIFMEKDVTIIEDAFLNQLNSSEELFIGSCKLDLFQLLVESKMILFKRLNKIYNTLARLTLKNKNEIRDLVRIKLRDIESDLEFNSRYVPQIKEYNREDARKLIYRAIHNVLEQTDLKLKRAYTQDIKAFNGFYAVKAKLMETFNDGSMDRISQLNLSILPALKKKLGINFEAALKPVQNVGATSENDFAQDTFSNKGRRGTKYNLGEATMQSFDQFFIKPQYMSIEGKKREIDPPSQQLYKKIGNDTYADCHYRLILPCALENSAYLEDYSSWMSYGLNSFRDNRVADIRSKISIIDSKDQEFFKQLDAFGIDTKVFNLQAGDVFGSYTPNEKLKINIYLVDMLIHDEIAEEDLSLEIRIDDVLLKKIYVDELKSNKESIIDILELMEHTTKLGKAKFINIDLIRTDLEFNEAVTIACTSIDIEQRYFCNAFHRLTHKPIETRNLQSKINGSLMGKCRLWIDIYSRLDNHIPKKYILKKPRANEVEVRLVVWNLEDYRDIAIKNEYQEMYIQAEFISTNKLACITDKIQQTQARFIYNPRTSLDFNHRMIWRFKGGRGSHQLRLSLFNVTNASNFEAYIDLTDLSRKIIEADLPISKATDERGYPTDFIIPTMSPHDSSSTSQIEALSSSSASPKIKVRLELFPLDLAQSKPVGQGRSHPNIEPYLPEPIKGSYPNTDIIKNIYTQIPRNIKIELAAYLFIFLLGFISILLVTRSLFSHII